MNISVIVIISTVGVLLFVFITIFVLYINKKQHKQQTDQERVHDHQYKGQEHARQQSCYETLSLEFDRLTHQRFFTPITLTNIKKLEAEIADLVTRSLREIDLLELPNENFRNKINQVESLIKVNNENLILHHSKRYEQYKLYVDEIFESDSWDGILRAPYEFPWFKTGVDLMIEELTYKSKPIRPLPYMLSQFGSDYFDFHVRTNEVNNNFPLIFVWKPDDQLFWYPSHPRPENESASWHTPFKWKTVLLPSEEGVQVWQVNFIDHDDKVIPSLTSKISHSLILRLDKRASEPTCVLQAQRFQSKDEPGLCLLQKVDKLEFKLDPPGFTPFIAFSECTLFKKKT